MEMPDGSRYEGGYEPCLLHLCLRPILPASLLPASRTRFLSGTLLPFLFWCPLVKRLNSGKKDTLYYTGATQEP